MSKRALNAQYQNANQRLNEAEKKVVKVSADRLNAIMRRPHAEQLSAIDDPDLTPLDRKKLREALMSSLRPSRARAIKWRTVRIYRGFTHAFARNAVSFIIGCVFFLPPCVALFFVWHNTASLIIAPSTTTLDWIHPSGALTSSSIQAGQKFGAIRNLDGSLIIRQWSPGEGYVNSNVAID